MKHLAAALLLIAATGMAMPAAAQFSASGGPIDITANELELVDAQDGGGQGGGADEEAQEELAVDRAHQTSFHRLRRRDAIAAVQREYELPTRVD